MLLINTVSGNNQGFYEIKINGAEQTETLYYKLGYTSVKNFRWIVQSRKIIDCPVTVQDIEIANAICGKNFAAL